MIELSPRDEDSGLMSALWRSGTALTSEAAALIDELSRRLHAAERRLTQVEADRDYWRVQHDLTLADWKMDLQELSVHRSRQDDDGGAPDPSRRALVGLLRFFDAQTGAVAGRRGENLLSDAFAEAASVCQAPRYSRDRA